MLTTLQSILLFCAAALFEVGGAYLIWSWRRLGSPGWLALAGIAALAIYGFIQTLQSFNFGRAFAAYGGVFIATALLWGWWVDGRRPDRWDWLGAGVCLMGAAMMLWGPRR
jgi:small multidrug resistance family-3 protein